MIWWKTVRSICDIKKNIERKQKQELGKNDRAVLQSEERVLRAHSIEKPYYHGGLYNGKAMNQLMTCSQTLMHDIQNVLLDAPVHDTRCSDDQTISWTEKFANILKVFDKVFSISRTPSGQLTEEQGRVLMLHVEESLRLWRGLSLNITQKVHAVEDHLCQQVCRLNGIGDLGEDFLEQSHQEGIKDHARTKNAKKERAANLHSNWDEQCLHPGVRDKMDAVKRKSVRMKRCQDGQQKPVSRLIVKTQEDKENKKEVRLAAFRATTTDDGVYLCSGREINFSNAYNRIVQDDVQRHEEEV
jgi:hypothetical protein